MVILTLFRNGCHMSSTHQKLELLTAVAVVSSPDTKFFVRTLWIRRKIGSGHVHCGNWGIIIRA